MCLRSQVCTGDHPQGRRVHFGPEISGSSAKFQRSEHLLRYASAFSGKHSFFNHFPSDTGVYQFFIQRNLRLRGSPTFLKGQSSRVLLFTGNPQTRETHFFLLSGEHCETYVRHFNVLFALGGGAPGARACDLSSDSVWCASRCYSFPPIRLKEKSFG